MFLDTLYTSLAPISSRVPSLWNRCVIRCGRDPVSDEIEGGGIRTLLSSLRVFIFRAVPIFRDPVPRYLSISIEFPRPRYIENFSVLRKARWEQRERGETEIRAGSARQEMR